MVPLFKPYMPSEFPELNSILHSGALSYGKYGALFEEKLGDFIKESRIIVVNSYNSAMLITLETLGVKPDDEVIASPMSCLASNQPFATQNIKIIWADIDPTTGTLCPESVKSKISSKTKAIFHNHYCGYLGYIDEINEIGKEKGIIIVDDAIEAFGSEYKGKRIGNVGTDATVFSFQTVRLPNTIEGAAIVFNNDDLYKKSILIRDYGVDRSRFRDNLGEISSSCDISTPGFGATLSDINCYIGLLQMKVIEELLHTQRNNANDWEQVVQQSIDNCELLSSRIKDKPNYWVFGLLSSDKIEMIKKFREKGYYASGVHLPNNHYSVFGRSDTLLGVEDFYSKFVAIPSGWWVKDIKVNV